MLLASGFLLTGVIGTWLSQTYAQQAAASEFASVIFKEERDAVGNRMAHTNELFYALLPTDGEKLPNSERLKDALAKYRINISDWNTRRPYLREMISTYYGEEGWNRERQVHYHLRALGASLERAYRSGVVDKACVENKRDKTLEEVGEFAAYLGRNLSEGRVGPKANKGERKKLKFESEFCTPISGSVASPSNLN